MNLYTLIWYNYIAQETWVDKIKANNEKSARRIAIKWIKKHVGHDDDFAENSIESLYESGYDDEIITEEMVN